MTPVRVLIVDDDETSLDALQHMLRLRLPDLHVETCRSAADALSMVARQSFDAVLADVAMPGMDGLQLLACLRRRRPEMPMLLMTGHGDRELAQRAFRAGACALIAKPVDRAYLVRALSGAISRDLVPRGPEHDSP